MITIDANDLNYIRNYAHKLMLDRKWTYSNDSPYWKDWNNGKVPKISTNGIVLILFKNYSFTGGDDTMGYGHMEVSIPTNDWRLYLGKVKYHAKTTSDDDLESAIFASVVKEIQDLNIPDGYSIKELLVEPDYLKANE